MTGHPAAHADLLDRFLTALFLIGIYLGIAVNLPGGTPVPSALAGVAGLAMLVKKSGGIRQIEVFTLISVLVLAAASILAAPDAALLGERFKGFIQFAYSIVIGSAFYLTAQHMGAATLGRFCLCFSLAILAVATLEQVLPSVRVLSDAFRARVFDFGIYDADVRDMALYGRVRPKVFTSEPSLAAFGFLLFAFTWYALSSSRLRLPVFLGLLATGYVVLRGPTILLGAPLIAVHQVMLAARKEGPDGRTADWARVILGLILAALVGVAGLAAGTIFLADRLGDIAAGRDASFFARIIAPPLVAAKIIAQHPVSGAGLSGWEFIDETVSGIYANSPWLGLGYSFESAAHAVTNYFWLHWIFLGLGFGTAMILALSAHLRALGAPCLLFCWSVWAVFGQAAGGYVDPRTWTVLAMAAVIAAIHEREASPRRQPPTRIGLPYGPRPSPAIQ